VKTFFIIVRHIFHRNIHLLRKKKTDAIFSSFSTTDSSTPSTTCEVHCVGRVLPFFLLYFQSAETISQYDRNTSEIVYNIVMKMI
jgi:hypothetical protein